MMKISNSFLIALFSGIFVLFNAGILPAETNIVEHQHTHGDEEQAVSGLSLDHGEKWKTDTALRQGMQTINDAVMQAVPAYHDAALTKTDADKLARQINEQVNYLVANCKLEPGADATLHVFIGDLLTAAARLSDEPSSSQGLPVMVKTLQQYPSYFDHPGWNKLEEE